MTLVGLHWVLVVASAIFAALFFGNGRDKSLTYLVWVFMIALSTVDVLILLGTPRPAPARTIADIAVVWGLLPPLYFYIEWFVWRSAGTTATRAAAFQSFRYTQDMGARVWSAIGIVLVFLAQFAMSKPGL